MKGLWRDVRLGLRSLAKSPAFTIVALVTLALGIGANTAIFSAVDRVLLHPLPYPQPNRIVAIEHSGQMMMPAGPNARHGEEGGPVMMRERHAAPSEPNAQPGAKPEIRVGGPRVLRRGQVPQKNGNGRFIFFHGKQVGKAPAPGAKSPAGEGQAQMAPLPAGHAMAPGPPGHVRERTMVVGGRRGPGGSIRMMAFSYPDYEDVRKSASAFEEVAAYHQAQVTLTRRGQPASLAAVVSSASLFPLLSAKPILGRLFTEQDDREGAAPVAVIGEGLWRSRFGATTDVLGKTIDLNNQAYTVIGVLPGTLEFPPFASQAEVWIPLVSDPDAQMQKAREMRGAMYLEVLGRLKSGVTLAQANAQLSTIADRISASYPMEPFNQISAEPLAEHLVKDYRLALFVLFGAVGLVLLIACANVANLLLARATVRERELALRLALGAGRAGVIRQMLVESLELAIAGGAAGVFLAYLAVAAFEAHLPPMLREFQGVAVSGWVLAFAAAISMGAGIVMGLLPAVRLSDLRVHETLKQSGSAVGSAMTKGRLRKALVMIEVALAVILLAGAGLLLRSFGNLVAVPLGFQPNGVLMARTNLSSAGYKSQGEWQSFVQTALQRIGQQPGVEQVAAAGSPPMSGMRMVMTFSISGQTLPPDEVPAADIRAVTPGYFRLMGIPLVRGRAFADTDTAKSASACIVNQAFVQRYFPSVDTLTQQIVTGMPQAPCQIVGVVGNVISTTLKSSPSAAIYRPFAQSPFFAPTFLVRAGKNPAAGISMLRDQLQSLNSALPVMPVPLTTLLSGSVAQTRLRTELVALFAALALVLAAVGISGVMAYSVTRRTQEIGVRMALGATPGEVLAQVVREGLLLVAIGAAAGIMCALALTRFMTSLLFHVNPGDPFTYIAVAVLLLLVACGACALPAYRAARVNPTVALRYE